MREATTKGRKPTITDGGRSRSAGDWYLATTSDVMRFYCFDVPADPSSAMSYTIIDHLDRTRLTAAGSKETAKAWAKRLGLTSWTYVRV